MSVGLLEVEGRKPREAGMNAGEFFVEICKIYFLALGIVFAILALLVHLGDRKHPSD